MQLQLMPYIPYLLATAVIAIALAVQSIKRRETPAAAPFVVIAASLAVYSFAYAMELASVELRNQNFWIGVEYIGIATLPVAWLLFALKYTNPTYRLPRLLCVLLVVIPLTTLIVVWTNNYHFLYYATVAQAEVGGYILRATTYGPWFILNLVVSYLLMLLGLFIIIRFHLRTRYLFRLQGIVVTIAAVIPMLSNLLFLSDINPVPHLDLTPFAFMVTCLLLGWAVLRLHLMDIMPIARDTVLEAMDDMLLVLDPNDRIVDMNRALTEGEVVNRATVIGHPASEVSDKWAQFLAKYKQTADSHFEVTPEDTGKPGYYDVNITVLHNRHGSIAGRVCVVRDITEKRVAQEALRQSEKRYRTLFEQSPVGICHYTADLTITDCNRAFGEVLQIQSDKLVGSLLTDLPVPGIERAPEEIWRRQHWHYEGSYIPPQGIRERHIALHTTSLQDEPGAVSGGIAILEDTTQKRQLEQERQRASNLESLGTLAAGLAHDFNNHLSAIALGIGLARLQTVTGTDIEEKLLRAEDACHRAQQLSQRLLIFSRGGAPVLETAPIAEILVETASFSISGSNVRAEFDIPKDLWAADVDPGQISQVINNLVLNALQAMPGGGKLTITARNTTVTDSDTLSLEAGKYVHIAVRDEGIGIPAGYMARIFDPYFTTKHSGHGLGLTASHSIITAHRGHISVESTVGDGTVFHIYLPSPGHSVEAAAKAEKSRLLSGEGRILIMDDNDAVRTMTDFALREMGYEPVMAADGQEAIELVKAAYNEGTPFAAVILDLTVPGGMGGVETLAVLREEFPDICAIAASGYSHDSAMTNHQKLGFKGALVKPFSLQQLAEMLERVLGSPQ